MKFVLLKAVIVWNLHFVSVEPTAEFTTYNECELKRLDVQADLDRLNVMGQMSGDRMLEQTYAVTKCSRASESAAHEFELWIQEHTK